MIARCVHDPAGFEAYNANYVGGDIIGGVQDWRQFFTRPAPRIVPYTTPVRGLYICSSSTPPGGGVHGMCGYFAARTALRGGLLVLSALEGVSSYRGRPVSPTPPGSALARARRRSRARAARGRGRGRNGARLSLELCGSGAGLWALLVRRKLRLFDHDSPPLRQQADQQHAPHWSGGNGRPGRVVPPPTLHGEPHRAPPSHEAGGREPGLFSGEGALLADGGGAALCPRITSSGAGTASGGLDLAQRGSGNHRPRLAGPGCALLPGGAAGTVLWRSGVPGRRGGRPGRRCQRLAPGRTALPHEFSRCLGHRRGRHHPELGLSGDDARAGPGRLLVAEKPVAVSVGAAGSGAQRPELCPLSSGAPPACRRRDGNGLCNGRRRAAVASAGQPGRAFHRGHANRADGRQPGLWSSWPTGGET